MGLKTRLLARIDAEGPLPFEDFMAACLYDPEGGFFGAGPLRSVEAGDFLTSPEVSPWFGRILARYVEALRGRLSSGPFTVVEAGAGSGSLLASLLAALVSPPDDVWVVEASPAARRALGERIPGARVVEDTGGLPSAFDGVIIANELIDNLPVAIAVRTPPGWEERWVGRNGSDLALVPAAARPEVAAWASTHCGDVRTGGLVEVQLSAERWLENAMRRLRRGAILVIDYGGTAEELEPRRTLGTLRTYRAHHLGPDPLLEPGATDVTADVNFTPLLEVARTAGFAAALHRQDDFLAGLGLREELTRLRHLERELAAEGETMKRLEVRAEITDAETLLHPRGLGDFRVLEVRREPFGASDSS